MEFSQSLPGKAQTPAACQFCEELKEIKWKCINCELFLCQLCCSKIHNKIKASMEHEIINLKDFETVDLATSVRKVDLENMVCTIHDNQKCFVFCKDCSEPSCSKCLRETHKLHDYKALDEVYKEIISEMKELIKRSEDNLKLFSYEKEQLQKKLSNGDNNFQETRDLILQTEKDMKEVISKHAKDLLKELEAKWKPTENIIKIELLAITKNEEKLETRKNNLLRALQSHQAIDIFSTSKTLDKALPQYSCKKIKTNKVKFIHTNIELKKGSQSVLGDIYTIPAMELKNIYRSDIENVTNILLCSDKTAFIGSTNSKKIQKIKFETNNIKVEREIQIKLFDMARYNDDEILVSSKKSDLKLYTKDGRFTSFKSFSSLRTTCVHVTKDNKITVGLVEYSPDVFHITKDSHRKVLIMNQNGDIQHTIEYDKDNQRLLTQPKRIKSFNYRIVVVDIINNEREGRVVMFDYGGQLHWTYNGCNSIISDRVKFYPADVSITSTAMILVSECGKHAIHVLNPAGEVIVCNDVKVFGIELPFSLDIDNNEVLWIGCNTWGEDKIKKAKIICVKLT
ncbi:tripartite motif-containing protein 45-like [Mytilus californianus]|uniref:tripartite motif-containing protein 45-like n=1 Tax=Mytilus californianus TaxID=6549 RepID=UPI0022479853|nr:tripartite motif-containing protein 45-like [Mytilus californianus]